MCALGGHELLDGRADLRVVQAHADELDVEGVAVPAVFEHGLGLLEGLQRTRLALDAQLDLLADERQHLEDEELLGLEVIVDEALGHPGLLRDLFDRGVLVALAGEDGEGGVQDLLAGVACHLVGYSTKHTCPLSIPWFSEYLVS